jgi:Ca2+-binding RTX toxin-like protein
LTAASAPTSPATPTSPRALRPENDGYAFGEGSGDWNVTSAAGGSDELLAVEGVVGTRFADRVFGGDASAELIRGGSGNDVLEGGYYSQGSDTIYGGGGNDIVLGGEEIVSYRGTFAGQGDRFFGGSGNDVLRGLDGADTLRGEAGADFLSGGPDRDVLAGGAGGDTFAYLNNPAGIGSGTLRATSAST